MHCSQPCYSLYCYPSCTLSPNLSFNFLCCDCFYLYIDGFYIWYVLLYLNVVSVLFRLNSLLPSAMCISVCVCVPCFCCHSPFQSLFCSAKSLTSCNVLSGSKNSYPEVFDRISVSFKYRIQFVSELFVSFVLRGAVSDTPHKIVFYNESKDITEGQCYEHQHTFQLNNHNCPSHG